MAYQKQQENILAGSINLHPPGDQLSPSDAQDIKNFAFDAVGNLRSRKGHTSIGTLASAIHSQIKALGNRYQGAGDSLYMSLAAVTNGFDAHSLGLAAYKRWLWVMNRSKQGKHDGTDFRNWTPTAPTDTPTAAVSTEYATTITTFDNSETWTVDPSGDDSFDASEKQEGSHSLSFAIPEDKVYTATRTVSLDLSEVGGAPASLEDKHRINIFCNKFKKLDEIVIELDCNAGDFATDYFSAVIPRKHLKRARKGWRRFEIRKRPLLRKSGEPKPDKKQLPIFIRYGATANKGWDTIAAIRIKIDSRSACTVKLDKWDVYGASNSIEGDDIQYYFTYVNDDGHESNPSPVSDPIAVDNAAVEISGLTASAEAGITGKHVYRQGGFLTEVYRVTETPVDNGDTTFIDTMSDDDAERLGFIMDTDNDPPPAARVLAGPYLGLLLAASTSDHLARMFWTPANQPYKWPGAAMDEGNWVDVGDTGEEIIQLIVRPRMVLIYKENSIWRLIGDPDDTSGEVEETRAQIGLIGRNAVCKGSDVDYLQAKDGLYSFNGDTAQKISEKIEPIFRGLTTTLASGITIPPISEANRDKACLQFHNDRLIFSYPEEGQALPNTTLVLHLPTGRWTRDSRGFRSIYNEGQNGDFLGGLSSGELVALEEGTTDSGSGFAVALQSRYFDASAPDLDKTWEDFTIWANTAGQTLTITAYLNDGASSVALGTINSATKTRFVLQFNDALGVTARNISIRIAGTVSSEVYIYKWLLNCYYEARQAKSFDTDESDFGTHKYKEIRELKIDLDNDSSVAVQLYTDHPGEAMAARGSAETIAASTTRRMAHVMLDQDFGGFLHRIVMDGPDFRVYGMRALIQVVGTFLVGAKGEFYSSDELDFSTERVKLIREVEVIYKTAGTAELRIYSDLPGEVIDDDPRVSETLPATDGQQSVKVRVPGDLWGRLFVFEIDPTGDFQLEAIRVYLKTIGAPNASGWMWIPLPVDSTPDAQWLDVAIPPDAQA